MINTQNFFVNCKQHFTKRICRKNKKDTNRKTPPSVGQKIIKVCSEKKKRREMSHVSRCIWYWLERSRHISVLHHEIMKMKIMLARFLLAIFWLFLAFYVLTLFFLKYTYHTTKNTGMANVWKGLNGKSKARNLKKI